MGRQGAALLPLEGAVDQIADIISHDIICDATYQSLHYTALVLHLVRPLGKGAGAPTSPYLYEVIYLIAISTNILSDFLSIIS